MLELAPSAEDNPSWRRFRALLLGLVACRGLVLLCVLPPFEGWDEYQHVGYIQHVWETGGPAIFGETRVPPALLSALAEFPQARSALDPRDPSGRSAYVQYWARRQPWAAPGPAPPPPQGEIPLYQAQHGEFYYRLVAPLFAAAGGVDRLRSSVGALRLLNLVMTVVAVAIALGVVGRHVRDCRHAAVIGLLIATQPLFLANGVRVSNDALGVMLATAAVATGLSLNRDRLLCGSATLGVLTGLSILAKATNFGLVPFAACCWLVVVARDGVRWRIAAPAAALLISGALAVTLGEFRSNYARYGLVTPMQEPIVNRILGRSATDLLRTAGQLDWGERLGRLWLCENLGVGGWSFIPPTYEQIRVYRALNQICLVGWLFAVIPLARQGHPIFRARRLPMLCLIICAGYTAALAYHMVQSSLSWGSPSTGAWYACPAYPWFLALVAGGGLAWPLGRYRVLLPAALAVTLFYVDSVLVLGRMAATYAGGASGWEILRRLAYLQPAPLGTSTLLAASGGAVILFAVILRGVFREPSVSDLPGAQSPEQSGSRSLTPLDSGQSPGSNGV
jgi:4-amino-4-deoxy-L-arabinose transferase-like glycosyltransferase